MSRVDLTDMLGTALDDITEADARWFDDHPYAPHYRRAAYPAEIDLLAEYVDTCGDYSHYRVTVSPTSTRYTFGKTVEHRDGPGRPWRVVALGAAVYPAGTDLSGRWSS
ncbi:MAG: hypothetical protein R2737_11910 [Candidatus Nanopelagicales bacterium]